MNTTSDMEYISELFGRIGHKTLQKAALIPANIPAQKGFIIQLKMLTPDAMKEDINHCLWAAGLIYDY